MAFNYEIKTTWNGEPIDHEPVTLTLEKFETGVALNVSAPFFNDPAPDGPAGKPFFKLWDYEVAEAFFLNDAGDYLEVELSPWGQHLVLLLKGRHNAILHSIPLEYVVTKRQAGEDGGIGHWTGSALIPTGYFPPKITKFNAFAIHGTDDSRVYEALYPAPKDHQDYPNPDFHRLELFKSLDFDLLALNNEKYSDFWLKAISDHGQKTTTATPKTASVK